MKNHHTRWTSMFTPTFSLTRSDPSTLFSFQNRHCIQPQQHWSKHHSKVVTSQERLLSIIQFFCQGVLSFKSFANEVTHFERFLLSTTYLFHYILFILILGICTDTRISSPHISCILANKALTFFVTLPTLFLITFLLT